MKNRKKSIKFLLLFLVVLVGAILIGDLAVAQEEYGKIKVTKTATKIYDGASDSNLEYGRLAEVSLQVDANPYTESSVTNSKLDIVIVFDGSGSMAWGENGEYDFSTTDRIISAKEAATDFADTLMDSTGNVQIGIVEFGSRVKSVQELTSNKVTVTNFINTRLNANGGTNLQAGIERANELLDNNGREDAKKIVIILTDGVPTYFNGDSQEWHKSTLYGEGSNNDAVPIEKEEVCSGYGWNKHCWLETTKTMKPSEAAKEELDGLKAEYTVADVYTITFGNESEAADILSEVNPEQESPLYKNYEALTGSELKDKFQEIINQTKNIIGSNAEVIDVIPMEFSLTDESRSDLLEQGVEIIDNDDGTTTLKWTIGDISANNLKELSYVICAKDEYHGSMYTNESAILNVVVEDSNPYYEKTNLVLSFDKEQPTVEIPAIANDDHYSDNDSYTGYGQEVINGTTILNNDLDNNILKDNENNALLEVDVVDSIVVNEDVNTVKVDDNTYSIYKDSTLQGTLVMNNDGTFTFSPEEGIVGEVTFSYHIDTRVNPYKETNIVHSNDAVVTLCIMDRDRVSVNGTKTWIDNNDQDGIRPDSITVRLFANGEEVNSAVVTSSNNWEYAFTNLYKYELGHENDSSYEIEYTVVEDSVEGYTTTYNGYDIINTHEPELINEEDDDPTNDGKLTVTKVWDDNNNQDGIRSSEVEVTLYANDSVVDTVKLNQSNGWTYTFENLDKYANGSEIVYTIEEVSVDGYISNITGSVSEGFTITNTHELELINEEDDDPTNDGKLVVTKVWDDNNNQDNIRPTEIEVTLYANDSVVDTVKLNESNGWTYTFEGLYKYANGSEIVYTIEEVSVLGYTSDITGSVSEGFTITNIHEPEKINEEDDDPTNDGKLVVTKVWEDDDNRDGLRTGVSIVLKANGVVKSGATLNESNNWTYTFEDLDKYANGSEIVYTIEEVSIDGYISNITGSVSEGFTITNTHEPELINEEDDDPTNDGKLVVTKVWDDNNNQDNIRPTEIEVTLYANGSVVDTVKLNESNGWTYTFEGLYKYDNGIEIEYSVEEVSVTGYTSDITGSVSEGFTVTNTHEPELYNGDGKLVVTKVWDDNSDQDGKRPEDITIGLYADGVDTGKTIILNESNNWTGTFSDLDKYADGGEIEYTIAEINVPDGYEVNVSEVVNGKVTITNTYEPELINEDDDDPTNDGKLVVTKVWDDNSNQDGKRPVEVEVILYANDSVVDTVKLNESNDWTYTFEGLYKYANGSEIEYRVEEVSVIGYTSDITGSVSEGFTVTNSYTPELTTVYGKKIWDDNNNQDGIRPESIIVRLYADGVEVDLESNVITGSGNEWTYAFTNLPKYKDGKEITYTVLEEVVDGYDTVYSEENPYVIINTHKTATTDITGTKTWDDNDNQDGIRPDSITVRLYADGDEVASKVVTASDNWTYSFDNLDVYKDGKIISYTISEDAIEGYSTKIDGYNIINMHTPEEITITGSKTWDDNNNQDGKRPDSITVNLLANGEVIDSKVVTASDNWTYSFTNLDKYANGEEIVYSLTEDSVLGYDTVINDFNITNIHEIEKITFSATKVWDDNDNQDGIRVKEIKVSLYKNGELFKTVTISEDDNWTYEFTDLDRYENGNEIIYTIVEEVVEGYDTTIDISDIDEDNIISATITNSHEPELINENDDDPTNDGKLVVTKVWNDNNNQDGIRPESVIIKLLANGEVIRTIVLDESNNWTYVFEGLYKYANGSEIVYTIEEVSVTGYTSYITGSVSDGFTVTNSHEPELINEGDDDPTNDGKLVVTKVWDDNNDQDGIRPESIIVKLLANGEVIRTIVLDESNNWTYVFEGLYKYANGSEIEYTIEEVSVIGYTSYITGSVSDGFTVTNSHIPETITITGTKIWEDYNDLENVRPDSIRIDLYADGNYLETIVVSSLDDWKYIISDLPKYNNGSEIVYTIIEQSVERYITTYDGFDIINTLELGKGDGDIEVIPPQTGIYENTNNNMILYIVMVVSSIIILLGRKTILVNNK